MAEEIKDVFISYKAEEYEQADWVRQTLVHNGIACWMAPESIATGSNYAVEIPKAIHNCTIMVLILSNKSQNSVWVNKEIEQALSLGKKVFPFMIEEFEIRDDLNFSLSESQRFAAYESKEEKTKEMVMAIKGILGMPFEDDIYLEPETTTEIFNKSAKGTKTKVVYRSFLYHISPAKKIPENATKLKFTFKVHSTLTLILFLIIAFFVRFEGRLKFSQLMLIAFYMYILWHLGYPVCKRIAGFRQWNKPFAVVSVILSFNLLFILSLLTLYVIISVFLG